MNSAKFLAWRPVALVMTNIKVPGCLSLTTCIVWGAASVQDVPLWASCNEKGLDLLTWLKAFLPLLPNEGQVKPLSKPCQF